jgi:hypothetical protein
MVKGFENMMYYFDISGCTSSLKNDELYKLNYIAGCGFTTPLERAELGQIEASGGMKIRVQHLGQHHKIGKK